MKTLIGVLLVSVLMFGCGGNQLSGQTVAEPTIKIPLSSLSTDISFYEFNDGGTKIRYFAVLGSDGLPRTAFDACDVCGGYKGYEQKGSDIKCRNCGREFAIDGLGSKNTGSGCWPGYLEHIVENGKIIIKVSDLRKGKGYFA